jgi:hypothetical protein
MEAVTDMVLLITGSRSGVSPKYVRRVLRRMVCPGRDTVLVGGAAGVDSVAEAWCRRRGVAVRVLPAAWSRWGRRAGLVRNLEMVRAAGPVAVCLAFPRRVGSRGTWHCVGAARAAGLRVFVFQQGFKKESVTE